MGFGIVWVYIINGGGGGTGKMKGFFVVGYLSRAPFFPQVGLFWLQKFPPFIDRGGGGGGEAGLRKNEESFDSGLLIPSFHYSSSTHLLLKANLTL